MARKRCVFFHSVQPLLKQVRSGGSLTFLVLSLGTGGSSASASVPIEIPPTPLYKGGKGGSSVQGSLEATQLVQQGRKLYAAEQFYEAVTVWQQAAQDYQAQKNVLNQAMVLSNLSLAYQQLGQWEQASKAIAQSLNLLNTQDRGNPARTQILAQALNTQGTLQLALGQAQQALITWQKAATTYAAAGDQTGVTRSQINQAQALQALGLYRRALATLNSVNQILQKQPDSLLKVAGLRSLGNTLRLVGDLEQSQQILQQSLALAQQLKSSPDIGAAFFSLGNTARASFGGASLTQQDTKAALSFYQQAAISSSSQLTKIQAQLNQLSLLLETKQLKSAQALLPQIKAQITALPSSSQSIYAQIEFAQSLMKLEAKGEKQAKAIAQLLATSVQQAKNLGDQRAEAYAIGNLGGLYEQNQQQAIAKNLTEQALLLSQSINAPDIAYRWQWQLGRLLKAEKDNQGAIASYTEAVNTLKSLRSDLVAVNPEIQFSFRDEVEPVYRELVDLLLQSQGNQPSQQNLVQARSVIESLQLAELDNFFREACLEAKSVLIDKIIEQDNPTAAVIYPIILRDRLEVILKIPNQPLRHYTIKVSQNQVDQTIEELQQKLTEPDTIKDVKLLSQQVYSWLIQPAETELQRSGVKTLVFVLDGSLRNIPMAALYDGKQYLIEKYAVALSLGLQLLDPKPLPQGRLKALTAGLSVAIPNFPYPPLSAVKSEFNLIEKAGVSISQLLDQKFTSKTLENEIASSPFNVIHLATHGQFSSQAKNTFILASDGPINVDQLDNLLRTRNRNSANAVELLVLSACETATGDKRATLGLAGVSVRAGARSTLASLWQIDDQATAMFIGEFYQELAKSKVTKAEALRRAQLTLMKKYPNYSRPSFWAPYVLVGNWL
ncbi:MAG: CHAT domain-containing protein [Gloeocapsa sp. UFS-A4-WI-NPMV-4B04]|jgi:CHAT domain-containing protein|nr:CHAT domain-containing protein [Gloeocapsa sp. UFS-A4-WI-NPMV-4B04]